MTANPVLWNLDERGVATVTLNRPLDEAANKGGVGGLASFAEKRAASWGVAGK